MRRSITRTRENRNCANDKPPLRALPGTGRHERRGECFRRLTRVGLKPGIPRHSVRAGLRHPPPSNPMNSLLGVLTPVVSWFRILCVFALLVGGAGSAYTQPGGSAPLTTRAEAGDPAAQTEMGLRLIAGGAGNYPAAAEWFRRAALQGYAAAQLEIGVMYVNGEGVAEDLHEAYAWYLLASQQGNAQASEYLQDLDRSISPADRERARIRARELTTEIRARQAPKPKHGQHRQPGVASPESTTTNPPPDTAKKSATPAPPARTGSAQNKEYQEGKDYSVWQRVRVKDQNGFGQPVEAYSLLLPKGWRTEGGVSWVINVSCPADAVQNRLTATSEDGAFRLEVFPQRNWQWYDDPMLLQNAQNAAQFSGGGCPLGRPFDAGQYLEQVFLPGELRGATLISQRPDEQLGRLMREQAQRANATFQAGGVQIESRPSAVIGRIQWPDRRIGIALCAVEQTVGFMPNLINGGTYASYQCRATVRTVLSAPAGREADAEKLLATIVASLRINPDWQSAVQSVYNNIARVELRETAKRAAIWRQTQNEISDIQRRTWEERQASQDRIAEGWGKALRGVDTWSEPGGTTIELSAGYNEAWSKGDGTYILSNDALFDPNVVFQEDWKRLEKKP